MGLLGALRLKLREARTDRLVRAQMQVLHGPARVNLAQDQAGVVSLMKDAEYWVADFIRHHHALGAAHVVIMDNGSSDRTVEIARGFDRVTVLQNTLPAKQYECPLRAVAARMVLRGGWVLFVDSDEMAEVPCGLHALLRYCNGQGFTAVTSQMLDMFAPLPLSQTRGLDYGQSRAVMDRYTLEGLQRAPYHLPDNPIGWFLRDNTGAEGIQMLSGGVRRLLFNEDCMLTKHSLVRNVAGVRLMTHPHAASGVVVADVSLVLKHYKLAGDFLARDRASVAAGTWDHAEDVRRVDAAGDGDFTIRVADPRVYEGPGRLVEDGFLAASQAYSAFCTGV